MVEQDSKNNTLFSGVARSIVCFDNNGFRNYKIVNLHIKNGKVMRTELSDAFASFEALIKLDSLNDSSLWNLNSKWKNGEAITK